MLGWANFAHRREVNIIVIWCFFGEEFSGWVLRWHLIRLSAAVFSPVELYNVATLLSGFQCFSGNCCRPMTADWIDVSIWFFRNANLLEGFR